MIQLEMIGVLFNMEYKKISFMLMTVNFKTQNVSDDTHE